VLGLSVAHIHLVWGRVPLTGVAAAVIVWEWGRNVELANVDHLTSMWHAPAGASLVQPASFPDGGQVAQTISFGIIVTRWSSWRHALCPGQRRSCGGL
jgi:hypothetical protein